MGKSGGPAVLERPELESAALPESERSELERLRREVAMLRAQQLPGGLDDRKGRVRTYRVKLKGLNPKLTTRTVQPRLTAPAHLLLKPIATYGDLDLFLHEAGGDPLKIEQAAWRRYAAAQGLDAERDRRGFDIFAENGPAVESLDFLAASPADAFDLFCRLNGITSTSVRPQVEALPEAEIAGPGAASAAV